MKLTQNQKKSVCQNVTDEDCRNLGVKIACGKFKAEDLLEESRSRAQSKTWQTSKPEKKITFICKNLCVGDVVKKE